MIIGKTLVFDKLTKREGTIINLIGPNVCVIETVDNEKFTANRKLLTIIDKLTVPPKPTKKIA
jgi:hypothetical protein